MNDKIIKLIPALLISSQQFQIKKNVANCIDESVYGSQKNAKKKQQKKHTHTHEWSVNRE